MVGYDWENSLNAPNSSKRFLNCPKMSHNVRFRQFPSCRMRKLFFHFLILGTDKMPLPLKVKQSQKKFRPEWCKDKIYEKWLTAVTGDETVAGCRFCSKTFSAKLQNIKTHRLSEGHKQHERDRGLSSQSARLMENFVATGGAESAKVTKRKEGELRMAGFVAEHTAFAAAPHLASLVGGLSDISPKLGEKIYQLQVLSNLRCCRKCILLKVSIFPF